MAVTAKTLAVTSAAQTLEERCNRFALLGSNTPPRVQERELNTVLEGLKGLITALGEELPFAPLGGFFVDENGLRTLEASKARSMRHVIYRPASGTLGVYSTNIPMRTEDGKLVLLSPLPIFDDAGNDLTRVISYADLIEIGYSPTEVVAFLAKLATTIGFDFFAKMSTSSTVGRA